MNVGKSIKQCLLNNEMKGQELAEKLCASPQYVSKISNRKYCTGELIERLSKIFDLKASEFIALGE